MDVSNVYLNAVLGLLWGTSDYSCFPFTSWIIYPAAGYLFGKRVLSGCGNKTRLYAVMTVAGGLLYAACSYHGFKNGVSFANFGEFCEGAAYYHMSLDGNVAVLSFVAMWVGLAFFLGKLLPGWCVSILQRLSKHITFIYVIHYLCISYGSLFIVNGTEMSQWGVLLTTLLILVISECVSSLLIFAKSRFQHRQAALQ